MMLSTRLLGAGPCPRTDHEPASDGARRPPKNVDLLERRSEFGLNGVDDSLLFCFRKLLARFGHAVVQAFANG